MRIWEHQLEKEFDKTMRKIASFLGESCGKCAKNIDQSAKKSSAKKIFGSNLSLSAKKITALPQNEWAALAAAHEKIGVSPDYLIVVPLAGIEPTSRP